MTLKLITWWLGFLEDSCMSRFRLELFGERSVFHGQRMVSGIQEALFKIKYIVLRPVHWGWSEPCEMHVWGEVFSKTHHSIMSTIDVTRSVHPFTTQLRKLDWLISQLEIIIIENGRVEVRLVRMLQCFSAWCQVEVALVKIEPNFSCECLSVRSSTGHQDIWEAGFNHMELGCIRKDQWCHWKFGTLRMILEEYSIFVSLLPSVSRTLQFFEIEGRIDTPTYLKFWVNIGYCGQLSCWSLRGSKADLLQLTLYPQIWLKPLNMFNRWGRDRESS